MLERLTVVDHGMERLDAVPELTLDADLADHAEIGGERLQQGRLDERWDPRRLRLAALIGIGLGRGVETPVTGDGTG